VYICSMKSNKNDQKCGIYCIRNIVNGKVYIGKSKNIYKRIYQHLYDLKNNRVNNENTHLLRAWCKYGNENFEYFVLEYLEINEELCKFREIYWMNKFNSLNREFGYNLRQDSSTNMITHKETSEKISKRLVNEWKSGIRKDHGKKLSDNWKTTPERNLKQSLIMSKNKTKYEYKIYDLNNNLIESCNYIRLKELGYSSVMSNFHRRASNKVKYKTFLIERVNIEDIVRSS